MEVDGGGGDDVESGGFGHGELPVVVLFVHRLLALEEVLHALESCETGGNSFYVLK